MSEQKNENGKTRDIAIKIFIGVATFAIIAIGSGYFTMSRESVETKAHISYSMDRLSKTEKAIDELKKAVDELSKHMLPKLAQISSDVEYIKNDIRSMRDLKH